MWQLDTKKRPVCGKPNWLVVATCGQMNMGKVKYFYCDKYSLPWMPDQGEASEVGEWGYSRCKLVATLG